MRLLNPTSTFLIPVLASTASASTSASPTPNLEHSDAVKLVQYWSPISTITHLASPTTNDIYSEADRDHDILRRQVITAPAAAAPSDPGQVSPVTTLQVNQIVNGVAQPVEVVYTQLFSAVPDQGEAPGVGSIGLGTIQGQVGVVRTAAKREAEPEPTEVANIKVQKRTVIEENTLEDGVVVARAEDVERVERRSLAGKVDANKAGSALALLVAIAVMIVV